MLGLTKQSNETHLYQIEILCRISKHCQSRAEDRTHCQFPLSQNYNHIL